ncbi:MAG: hypothetical protein E6J90_46920 [Deltaproteobacteria bacterium]|nr:MAG: hypothetical protein E6J90_46920 [Deltaproteobacteria bacterium]
MSVDVKGRVGGSMAKSALLASLILGGCATAGLGINPRMLDMRNDSPMLVMRDGEAVVRVTVVNYNDSQALAGDVAALADVAIFQARVAQNKPPCSTDVAVYSQPGRFTGQPVTYMRSCDEVHSIAAGKTSSVLPAKGTKAEVIELPLTQNVDCTKDNGCRGWYMVRVITNVPGAGPSKSESQSFEFDLSTGKGVVH